MESGKLNEIKDPVCKGTQLCDWLNKENCEHCIIAKKREDAKRDILKDFDITLSCLPDDIDDIYGEKCQFCAENPGEQEYYATLDITHPEPYSEKGAILGMGPKVRNPFGSFLRLDISCCKECRNVFKKYVLMKRLTVLITAAAGILSLTILFASGAILGDVFTWITIFLIVFALLAIIASTVASKVYVKKHNNIRTSVFEIPLIQELKQMGWSIFDDNANSDFSFSLSLSKNRQNGFGRLKSNTKNHEIKEKSEPQD